MEKLFSLFTIQSFMRNSENFLCVIKKAFGTDKVICAVLLFLPITETHIFRTAISE